MNLTGKIAARIPGVGRREDRGNATLENVWIRHAVKPNSQAHNVFLQDTQSSVPLGNGPVIVMLSGPCPAACAAIVAAAKRGQRVYVLAPTGWSLGDVNLAGVERGLILVRRVKELPASAVWVNGWAWLWMGSSPLSPRWRLALCDYEAAALRHAMLRLFWHFAEDEAWLSDGVLAFRPCADRPFDVPEMASHAVVRLRNAAINSSPIESDTVYCVRASEAVHARRKAFFAPSAESHAVASELSARSVDVAWQAHDLPLCSFEPAHAVLRPSSDTWQLEVMLSPSATNELGELLSAEPEWRFVQRVELKQLERSGCISVWMPGASAAQSIVPLERLSIADVNASSVRASAAQQPEKWPPPGPTTLWAEWQWFVRPSVVPGGAKLDPLNAHWVDFAKRFESRLDALGQCLEQAKREGSVNLGLSARLKGALLGFDLKRKKLQLRMRALSVLPPLATSPDVASSALRELQDLETEALSLNAAIIEAELTEQEQMHREAQLLKHNRRISESVIELNRLRNSKSILANDLDIFTRYEADKSDGPGTSDADRRASAQRWSDEESQFKLRLTQLDEQIGALETEVVRPFVYEPEPQFLRVQGTKRAKTSAKNQPAFVPERSSIETLIPPQETLPTVGRLVLLGKQRFLGIQHWSDLDVGELEATRLNAMLVADVETQ